MSDVEKVKKLRVATGAGFKDCNLAIKEANGDLDKAVEILRVKGISKASKKMSREAKEGVVAISGDEKKTSIISKEILPIQEMLLVDRLDKKIQKRHQKYL